ncbi:MAG: tRNA (guanosine(18)-2'-O)-methyltransferase TrmH [bacterium]|nr:tRNA (guanosine(18)-2'-O)-methyltransferase TrmH [bacterium]
MTPERFHRIRAVLERRQLDLTVLLENVHKPHNFAAVLRTADAVGLYQAHAVVPDRDLRTALVSASGADKWVEVELHGTTAEGLDDLGRRGLRILAAHPAPDALDYRTVDFTRPTAVLFGQEKDGLSAEALTVADSTISIPMVGFVTSLNVSVAAAVVLFEAMRQRAAAGLYAKSRMDSDLFARKLFEWAYPELADLCRRRGVGYPRLDEDGGLLDPLPR